MDAQRQKLLDSMMESITGAAIGIVVAILLLALGVHYLRSWYRGSDDPADNSDEILEQMRELHCEGDLSEEEFRSIKSQLKNRTET
ncbi:hypothetical protein OAF98_01060 [Planctomicrobium sp.]|jgi:uncharacterized membrane protein|nr:hypothetical protein [Planctomicrobium sp.]MBT5017509.1 hypothetical protein [Planctomicrobium sp.]MDB4743049.1 hypothetical protein [Planctomicrobium sp.]